MRDPNLGDRSDHAWFLAQAAHWRSKVATAQWSRGDIIIAVKDYLGRAKRNRQRGLQPLH